MPRSDPFSSAWEGVRLVQSKCARLTAWLGVQGCAATALSLCFSVHARARGHRDAWADASGPGIFAEVVSISSTRSAGVSDSAFINRSSFVLLSIYFSVHVENCTSSGASRQGKR